MGGRAALRLWLAAVWLPGAVCAQAPRLKAPDVTRDFAVPDAPAFLLVTADPGSILRPQTTRDVGVVLSQFRTGSGSFALPRAFAVEFSPAILVGAENDPTGKYRKLLSSFRLSAASQRDTAAGSPMDLAVGVRVSISDGAVPGDPQITSFLCQINNIRSAADEAAPVGDTTISPAQQQQVAALQQQIRRRWAEQHWNARVVDVAFAIGARTRDSTGVDPRLRQVAFLGTYANGWGNWGQVLVGARVGWRKDSAGAASRQSGALGLRLYVGRNGQKAFLEAEDQWVENGQAALRVGAGVELSLTEWAWFTASLVHEDSGAGPARSYTTFRFNSGLPGL